MSIFVIEDNWREGWTIVNDFGSDHSAAYAFLTEKEQSLYPWDGSQRVCYFRAESLSVLKVTHSNWFHASIEVARRR